MRTYTTVQGDMWDSIAYSQLGSVSFTDKLINLNRQYHGIFIFPAGIKLKLPDGATDRVPESTPPWKWVVG